MEWENKNYYDTKVYYDHASTSKDDQSMKNGNTPLHVACIEGNLDAIKYLVQNEATLKIKNFEGETPLHIAVKSKSEVSIKMIEVLLKFEVNINDTDNEGNIALHLACINNDPAVVNLLLKNGSNLNARNFYLNTPLHVCIESEPSQGQEDVIKILINNKADLMAVNHEENTPMHLACMKANLCIVKLLLTTYADKNAKNIRGNTPLHVSVYYASEGTKEIIKALAGHNINLNAVNKCGNTALHLAFKKGDINIIEILIRYSMINVFIKNHQGETPSQTFIKKEDYDEESKQKAEIITTILKNGPDAFTIFKNGNTSLHLACLKNDLLSVIVLLDNNANVMAKNQQGQTPLHFAIKSALSTTRIIKILLQQGAFINAADNDGNTPLHIAITTKSLEIIYSLLENNANVYIANKMGETPLYNIMDYNLEEIGPIIKLLQMFNVDINKGDNEGNTLLHIACMKNNLPIIKILLNYFPTKVNVKNHQKSTSLHVSVSHGSPAIGEIIETLAVHRIDLSATDKSRNTALHLACSRGDLKAVNTLLAFGGYIDKKNAFGHTSFHSAILSTSPVAIEVIHSLLKFRVNVNSCDLYGNTPLHSACMRKDVEIVQILLNCYAHVNVQNLHKNTPLYIVLSSNFSRETLKIIDVLMKYGANLGIPDINGNTALHLACIMGKSDVVNAILQYQPNVDARNFKLITPLHICVQFASGEFNKIIKALIRNRADINAANFYGDTALHFACFNGDLNAINALLDNCANINVKNSCGDTPLHLGVNFQAENVDEIVETLIRSQADINAINADGNTALHLACENDNREYAKALLSYEPDINIRNLKCETSLDIAVKNHFENIVEIFLKSPR